MQSVDELGCLKKEEEERGVLFSSPTFSLYPLALLLEHMHTNQAKPQSVMEKENVVKDSPHHKRMKLSTKKKGFEVKGGE